MPKALDVSKLIDKRNKDERRVVGYDASRARPNRVDNTGYDDAGKVPSDRSDNGATITAPASAESAPWSGHKTCSLKPAWEPVLCFKAPMGNRNYAELATELGSGALNVDGARVAADGEAQGGGGREGEASADRSYAEEGSTDFSVRPGPRGGDARGRYPANLVLGCTCRETGLVDAPVCGDVSGEEPSQRMGGKGIYGRSDERPPFEAYRGKAVVHTDPGCPCRMLDAQTGDLGRSAGGHSGHEEAYCGGYGEEEHYGGLLPGYGDAGGASRFFYQAKATRREREVGLLGLVPCHKCGELGSRKHANPKTGKEEKCVRNDHPTVKPVALCRWLATLLLPPASASPRRLLIPFSGSGSEVVGALLAGWDEVVGVEMDPRYSEIARRRCEAALRGEYDAIAKEDEG
jgi:site-specific DNA-methyltransferase (adenine-specific)